MELISNGNLPTTTTVNKTEELPYEGKPLQGGKSNNPDGMRLGDNIGNMGYAANAAPRPAFFKGEDNR